MHQIVPFLLSETPLPAQEKNHAIDQPLGAPWRTPTEQSEKSPVSVANHFDKLNRCSSPWLANRVSGANCEHYDRLSGLQQDGWVQNVDITGFDACRRCNASTDRPASRPTHPRWSRHGVPPAHWRMERALRGAPWMGLQRLT